MKFIVISAQDLYLTVWKNGEICVIINYVYRNALLDKTSEVIYNADTE